MQPTTMIVLISAIVATITAPLPQGAHCLLAEAGSTEQAAAGNRSLDKGSMATLAAIAAAARSSLGQLEAAPEAGYQLREAAASQQLLPMEQQAGVASYETLVAGLESHNASAPGAGSSSASAHQSGISFLNREHHQSNSIAQQVAALQASESGRAAAAAAAAGNQDGQPTGAVQGAASKELFGLSSLGSRPNIWNHLSQAGSSTAQLASSSMNARLIQNLTASLFPIKTPAAAPAPPPSKSSDEPAANANTNANAKPTARPRVGASGAGSTNGSQPNHQPSYSSGFEYKPTSYNLGALNLLANHQASGGASAALGAAFNSPGLGDSQGATVSDLDSSAQSLLDTNQLGFEALDFMSKGPATLAGAHEFPYGESMASGSSLAREQPAPSPRMPASLAGLRRLAPTQRLYATQNAFRPVQFAHPMAGGPVGGLQAGQPSGVQQLGPAALAGLPDGPLGLALFNTFAGSEPLPSLPALAPLLGGLTQSPEAARLRAPPGARFRLGPLGQADSGQRESDKAQGGGSARESKPAPANWSEPLGAARAHAQPAASPAHPLAAPLHYDDHYMAGFVGGGGGGGGGGPLFAADADSSGFAGSAIRLNASRSGGQPSGSSSSGSSSSSSYLLDLYEREVDNQIREALSSGGLEPHSLGGFGDTPTLSSALRSPESWFNKASASTLSEDLEPPSRAPAEALAALAWRLKNPPGAHLLAASSAAGQIVAHKPFGLASADFRPDLQLLFPAAAHSPAATYFGAPQPEQQQQPPLQPLPSLQYPTRHNSEPGDLLSALAAGQLLSAQNVLLPSSVGPPELAEPLALPLPLQHYLSLASASRPAAEKPSATRHVPAGAGSAPSGLPALLLRLNASPISSLIASPLTHLYASLPLRGHNKWQAHQAQPSNQAGSALPAGYLASGELVPRHRHLSASAAAAAAGKAAQQQQQQRQLKQRQAMRAANLLTAASSSQLSAAEPQQPSPLQVAAALLQAHMSSQELSGFLSLAANDAASMAGEPTLAEPLAAATSGRAPGSFSWRNLFSPARWARKQSAPAAPTAGSQSSRQTPFGSETAPLLPPLLSALGAAASLAGASHLAPARPHGSQELRFRVSRASASNQQGADSSAAGNSKPRFLAFAPLFQQPSQQVALPFYPSAPGHNLTFQPATLSAPKLAIKILKIPLAYYETTSGSGKPSFAGAGASSSYGSLPSLAATLAEAAHEHRNCLPGQHKHELGKRPQTLLEQGSAQLASLLQADNSDAAASSQMLNPTSATESAAVFHSLPVAAHPFAAPTGSLAAAGQPAQAQTASPGDSGELHGGQTLSPVDSMSQLGASSQTETFGGVSAYAPANIVPVLEDNQLEGAGKQPNDGQVTGPYLDGELFKMWQQ